MKSFFFLFIFFLIFIFSFSSLFFAHVDISHKRVDYNKAIIDEGNIIKLDHLPKSVEVVEKIESIGKYYKSVTYTYLYQSAFSVVVEKNGWKQTYYIDDEDYFNDLEIGSDFNYNPLFTSPTRTYIVIDKKS